MSATLAFKQWLLSFPAHRGRALLDPSFLVDPRPNVGRTAPPDHDARSRLSVVIRLSRVTRSRTSCCSWGPKDSGELLAKREFPGPVSGIGSTSL